MSNKEVFTKIGLILIIFLLFLVGLQAQGLSWASLPTSPLATANTTSLQLLWTTLVAATLIQGFVIFAALLGANLQFTPVKKGDDH
ncbi:MAG: hypothetical protein ACFFDI_10220 [Promethearchaeota archaeon]